MSMMSERDMKSGVDQNADGKALKMAHTATPASVLGRMSKREFIAFCTAATASSTSPEYEALYQFLLGCFKEVDVDFDGKVDAEEFDLLVEMAARDVRRLGLAPTHKQMYASLEERRAARASLFSTMDVDGSGFIGFEEWLQYAMKHIADKVQGAKPPAPSSLYGGKEEFLQFTAAVARSRASAEYKEFYTFLLTCFTEADMDRDGLVSFAEFDKMVERAGAFPRAHGLAPSSAEMYPSQEARLAARKKFFAAMDADRSGYIGFDEWLEFTYAHVCRKMEELAPADRSVTPRAVEKETSSSGGSTGWFSRLFSFGARPCTSRGKGVAEWREAQVLETDVPSKAAFSTSQMTQPQFLGFCRTATSDTSSPEYKQLYDLLRQYFTTADSDYDGLIDAEEFDMLVELAAQDVRRLGLAPTHKQTYNSIQDRRAARTRLFKAMDVDNSNAIGFEEWLSYCLSHIASKVKTNPAGKAFTMKGSKKEFLGFVRALTTSRTSAEYKEFYQFLLKCFVDSDADQDGQVNFEEFDKMVELAGAIPRLYGLAPTTTEMYVTPEARVAARRQHFKDMGGEKTGFIGFDSWLSFTYEHVCKKVKELDDKSKAGKCPYGFDQLGSSADVPLSSMSKNDFVAFCRAATTDKGSPEFQKLYQFLLDCFTSADNDFDGLVDAEEFDMMVELAAKDVRRLGLAPPHKQMYASASERRAARATLFKAMDADGSGSIGFEEWLHYALTHIAEKVKTAQVQTPASMFGSKDEFLRFAAGLARSGRDGAEFKEFYTVLLSCFTEADADRDGKVNFKEFNVMVEKAAAFPRSHGLAPQTSDVYKSQEDLMAVRQAMFQQMDADGSGCIGFEEWLEFTYTHVCKKVEELRANNIIGSNAPEDQPPSVREVLGCMSRHEFLAFCRIAISDRSSTQSQVLHRFLVDCFTVADADYDGKVDMEEFDMLVELAAKDVRRLGLAPTHKQTYRSAQLRRDARAKLFKEVDVGRTGFIGLEEWVAYALKHIASKVSKPPATSAFGMRAGKQEFLRFATALAESRASAEYKEFYAFLMQCFQDADQEMTGKVNLMQFDKMVEQAGALPRMYGLAPSTAEMYKTAEGRIGGRKKHFDAMDKDGSGFISFEEWLEFTYAHVCRMVKGMSAQATGQSLSIDSVLGAMSRSDFIKFCKVATSERGSPQYESLYQFLLEVFTKADNDYDGKVDMEDFDMMVEMAAKHVRRLGLAPTHKQAYSNPDDRRAARARLFAAIDADRSGLIGFEEWLQYSLDHIADKVKGVRITNPANMYGSKEEFISFAKAMTASRDSAEYKEFYRFLWQCFEEADQDRDAKVNLAEFDLMVEKAGAFPRKHGLAPATNQLYRTKELRIEGRRKHFQAMDADESGFISFDEWLEFTYKHVCDKIRELA